MITLRFNGEFVASLESDADVKTAIRDHLGTWAGNGKTAKIGNQRPIASSTIDGYIIEVESWQGTKFFTYQYTVIHEAE